MLGQGQEATGVPADGPMVFWVATRVWVEHAETEQTVQCSPKRMGERLEMSWTNVARVRALCLAVFGYDPEIEDWDQTHFTTTRVARRT